jgi:hypothetical protein
MAVARKVLSLGASYGSLLAIKLVAAGHAVTLACLPAEVDAFNANGARVRLPRKGSDQLVEVDSRELPGKLSAAVPTDIRPDGYDLVVLAMKEPQYRAPGVRELLAAVAHARVPCMSIMNMPPPPYLARIPGVAIGSLRDCYTDFAAWEGFDPALVTLCSPDPQAFRPPNEPVNVRRCGCRPTSRRRFASDAHTAMLREMERASGRAHDSPQGRVELPVKLKVHESVYVPLAKWSMCSRATTVASDPTAYALDPRRGPATSTHRARSTNGCQAVRRARRPPDDLVPFEKYANAALSLLNPSPAARALAAGAPNIERVDRLVQALGAQKHMRSDAIDAVVANVDRWIARNRSQSAAPLA